ncbi:MAG: AAA family ATPase, partial [Bacteroidota bacterium]|nr:AAA family ATPase [Bacteroidota bacterium]
MILRKKYLEQIKVYIDKPVIKVITGMRRVGKSYFVKQVIDNLKKSGINSGSILYINKELIKYDFIQDYKDLHEYVSEYFISSLLIYKILPELIPLFLRLSITCFT